MASCTVIGSHRHRAVDLVAELLAGEAPAVDDDVHSGDRVRAVAEELQVITPFRQILFRTSLDFGP